MTPEELQTMLKGSDIPTGVISDSAYCVLHCAKQFCVNGVVAGKDYKIARKLGIDKGTLYKYLPELERLHLAKRLTMQYGDRRIPAIRFGSCEDARELLEGKELSKHAISLLSGTRFHELKRNLRQLRILDNINAQWHKATSKKRKSTDMPMVVVSPKKFAHINKVSPSTARRDIIDLEGQDLIRCEKIDRYFTVDNMSSGIIVSMLKQLRKHRVAAFLTMIKGQSVIRLSLGKIITHLMGLDNSLYIESKYTRGMREKMISENLWYWLSLSHPIKAFSFKEALKAF